MIEGSSKDLKFIELLKIIELGEKTGYLSLTLKDLFSFDAKIYFINGIIVNASLDHERGESAFWKIAKFENYSFKFFNAPKEVINKAFSLTANDVALVLQTEEERRWNKIRKFVSSKYSIFSVDGIAGEDRFFSPLEAKILGLCARELTVEEIAQRVGKSAVDVAEMLFELSKERIVREVAEKDPNSKKIIPKEKPSMLFLRKLMDILKRK